MNLIEGLQFECERRRKILPHYESIGHPGFYGAAMLRMDIREAERAIAWGDVVEMVKVYQKLKEANIE